MNVFKFQKKKYSSEELLLPWDPTISFAKVKLKYYNATNLLHIPAGQVVPLIVDDITMEEIPADHLVLMKSFYRDEAVEVVKQYGAIIAVGSAVTIDNFKNPHQHLCDNSLVNDL